MDRLVLFLEDLTGIVNNHTDLKRKVEKGFPPGHMIGRRRAWIRDEVITWVKAQPAENKRPLRGAAKRAVEAFRARKERGA